MKKNSTPNQSETRAPVVCIMGHIDHGKSTLLDYIRKTNVVSSEAGGITQHMGAYEVLHETKDGQKHPITFLDTPGHAAFVGTRLRGVSAADIAILVVSGEDGAKPQTVEAMECIRAAKITFIIAISKIDKPNADVERTKQSLMEKGIYMEGYGGDAPCLGISSKTGEGVGELLDLILLVAELAELKADPHAPATGVIIETAVDRTTGTSATLIIKDGTLEVGNALASGEAFATVRFIENFAGQKVKTARPGSPAKVSGWNQVPVVGEKFLAYESKREAEVAATDSKKQTGKKVTQTITEGDLRAIIPVVIKADTAGTLEAIEHEIEKLQSDRVFFKILATGVGAIGENDLKIAPDPKCVIIGFNVAIDSHAKSLIERDSIKVEVFDIIYKLIEWLEAISRERTPKMKVEEISGKAKVLKIFSVDKDKQILGGRVNEGSMKTGIELKVMRRENEIGRGRIRELQEQKAKTSEVEKGKEFGAMIESKIEIAPGDELVAFEIVEK